VGRPVLSGRSTRHHFETLEEEYFFVLSGRCVVEVEGQHHDLDTGDFILTLPGQAHMFSNPYDEPCEFLAFGGPELPRNGCVYPLAEDLGWAARLEKARAPAT
jgi:mannose-6-phosphate isomerase-like protein (cupin superfamily)